jgi:hypothetical protein
VGKPCQKHKWPNQEKAAEEIPGWNRRVLGTGLGRFNGHLRPCRSRPGIIQHSRSEPNHRGFVSSYRICDPGAGGKWRLRAGGRRRRQPLSRGRFQGRCRCSIRIRGTGRNHCDYDWLLFLTHCGGQNNCYDIGLLCFWRRSAQDEPTHVEPDDAESVQAQCEDDDQRQAIVQKGSFERIRLDGRGCLRIGQGDYSRNARICQSGWE